MTRTFSLYITQPLRAEYQRRMDQSAPGHVLCKFPKSGLQQVSWPVALAMLEDARTQVRLDPCPYASREFKAYEALIRQIERRVEEVTAEERTSLAVNELRSIISLWRKS